MNTTHAIAQTPCIHYTQNNPNLYDRMCFNERLMHAVSLSLSDARVWSCLTEHINFESCQARVSAIEWGQW